VKEGSAIVVGAGLSGLACAFDLARAGHEVVVLEASERAGGVVGTIEQDGFRFETGPNTLQASAAAFRTLCGDLGIAARLIVSPDEQSARYVFVGGRLRALPATPLEFVSSSILSLRSRAIVCTEVLRAWKAPSGFAEPDAESFFTERFGAEAARVLAGSFVRGVYAAELSELGARSAFPRMWRALEQHKSLVRGLRALGKQAPLALPGPNVARTALLSFPDGLQELVSALERALGGRLRKRASVKSVSLVRAAGAWRATTQSGERLEAEQLVLAVPAKVAARLLDGAPRSVPLDHLRRIDHARVTLVHLGFEASELTRLPRGFGFLVPPPDASRTDSAGPRVLGTIFASNLFPGRAPRGCSALTCFYKSDDVESMNEEELHDQACRDLALVLGEARVPRPLVASSRRWSDVIPHYSPGHADRIRDLVARVDVELPGLHLAGSYVAGVSVDDVIARGRAVAREVLERTPCKR
jgi:oxygen-dependent protoporphyrinogen oxidase